MAAWNSKNIPRDFISTSFWDLIHNLLKRLTIAKIWFSFERWNGLINNPIIQVPFEFTLIGKKSRRQSLWVILWRHHLFWPMRWYIEKMKMKFAFYKFSSSWPLFYKLPPLIGAFLHHHCCKQSACSSTLLITLYYRRGPTWTVQPAHLQRPTQSGTVR